MSRICLQGLEDYVHKKLRGKTVGRKQTRLEENVGEKR